MLRGALRSTSSSTWDSAVDVPVLVDSGAGGNYLLVCDTDADSLIHSSGALFTPSKSSGPVKSVSLADGSRRTISKSVDVTIGIYPVGSCGRESLVGQQQSAGALGSDYQRLDLCYDRRRMCLPYWYNTIKFLLANAGLVEPENLNPLAEIQPGDLATLTHYGKNSITTSFRKRELKFLRVTPTLTPAASISLGPYPLRSVTGFTYTLGFDKTGPDALDWRVELDRFFRNTGLMDYDKFYPSAPSQEWDLTVLTYTSGHSIVTNFQEEKVELKRVARN
ncbi:hypothetical protein FOZ60_009000 [Perkinsus olseni]|uniref:Uncharacterized protein n=1 Tax=Perkinsus olseni TaxID=32597 RepID=A0A7J6NI64_PEROL|nr:hypothetical protein FOZ60_009000 [Perkinsus olseni]